MKILVNASTLSGTGVVQVTTSFLNECKLIKGNEYHVAISKSVFKQINVLLFPDNFSFYLIKNHPRFLFKGFNSRKKLKTIENTVNPDCVFSVFGPSWWTPQKPHLMGFAYPHYVYKDSPFFSRLSNKAYLKIDINTERWSLCVVSYHS